MSRFGRRGVTFKMSLITGGLLVLCTVLVFGVFYYWLPSFYHQYKINTLNRALDQLARDSAALTLQEAKPRLDAFTQDYNVWMGVQDQEGRYVYFPSIYTDMKHIYLSDSESDTVVAPSKRIDLNEPIDNMYTVSQPISFRDGNYSITANATLQPINEASRAILLFAPYLIVIVLLISVTGSVVYSRYITRPLLHINQVARRMANLDFERVSEIQSEDEIGELSHSLNLLSRNLQKTMKDLKQTNVQLSVEIHKERELEEKRKAFIATISHELKTPITAVMGQIEGMIHRIGTYVDRDKYLQRSYAIMQDMEKLVQELLHLSKMEAADFRPQRDSVDLSTIVRDCLKQLEYASGERQITVVHDIADGACIHADRKLLRKAFGNVIQNAIQYADHGGKIAVMLEQTPESVILRVLNSGEPIPEEELQFIFQPFHRVEKSRSRNTGGSGLGLHIVKQIVDLHGAACSISNTNKGVLFTIRFPREEDPR